MQIYPEGIRHIRSDKRVNEWKTPGKKTIVKCAVNQRQVVIALSDGELVYFEMDPVIFFLKFSQLFGHGRFEINFHIWGCHSLSEKLSLNLLLF